MSIVFSDDFNRADADLLGSNWQAEVFQGTLGDIDILNNRCSYVSGTSNIWTIVATTTAAHAIIADCKVTITQVDAAGDGGVIARVTGYDSTPTMYALNIFAATLETLRYDNSASATSLQSTGVTSVANGVTALEVTGSGATVTLKAYYQGTQRGTDISDTNAARITAAGATGIIGYKHDGATGDYDDFSVDDLTAGGASLTPTVAAASIAGIAGRMNLGMSIPTTIKI